MNDALSQPQDFRALAESSPDLVLRFDPEHRLTYVNPATAQLLQVPREALLHKTLGESANASSHPGSREGLTQVDRCLHQVFTTAASHEFEVSWPTASGERMFAVRLEPELDQAGQVRTVLAVARDTTERRQLGAALTRVLRHARSMVMRTVVTAPAGWDEHRNDVAWAAANFRWDSRFDDEASAQEVLPLELAPGESYQDGWHRSKLIEDQGPMGVLAHTAFLSGTTSWQQEFRCRDKHGRIHWFAQVASAEPAGDGCWKVTTVNTDITERKLAQQTLAAREREFRTLAENTPDFIVRWDRDLRRVYVNPAFAAATHVKPEQLIGEKLGSTCPEMVEQPRPDTIATVNAAIQRVFADERPAELLIPWTTIAGEQFHYLRLIPEFDSAGVLKTVLGIGRDITALKETEEQLRALTDNSPDLIVRIDREYRYLYANRAIETLTGVPAGKFFGRQVGELTEAQAGENGEQFTRLRQAIDHVFAEGEPGEVEGELRLSRGTYVLDGRLVPEFNQTGQVNSVLIIARDVTERRRAEEALRQSQQAFASLVTTIEGIVWEADPQTFQFTFVSPQAERILGYPAERWLSERAFWAEHLHPDDREQAVRYCVTATLEMRDHSFQYRMIAANGRSVWLHDLVTVISENGRPVKLRGIMVDITRSKRTEEALALFRTLIDHTTDAIEVIDPATGRFLDVNETACRAHGYSREEFLSLHLHDIENRESPRAAAFWDDALKELRLIGSKIFEGEYRRKDGSTFPAEVNANYVAGANDYIIAIVRDITERKRTEEALRESEYRFRQVTETIDEVFWLTDVAKQKMIYISPAYEKLWGRTCAELYENPLSWLEAIRLEDRERVGAALPGQREGSYDIEYRIAQPDGTVRWIHDRAFPIRDASGEVYRIAGVAEDITVRRQLEEQFRQSQKMEAIGQLAGGIAHDFNNLLTVVQMQTSLLLDERRLDAHAEQGVRQIMDAANRAANLTRQLLAFSRQQVKQAHALDLMAVVTSTTKLLRRVLGEHINLESRFASHLPCVHADPGMMEQVLMNLVINARDAMPEGGTLTISVDLVEVDASHVTMQPTARTGRFVRLAVADTGSGIAPEVLPRIFDPFFTTKEVGKGTGLGLATVFGIVQHHHGWIEIETAVGRGSTFRVYLPPLEKPADETKPVRPEMSPGGGSETVLLVEDEPAVASVAARALSRRGYNVLKAGSAAEALRVWDEQSGKVDLLLTDLVMPGGISGQKLAEELRQRTPNLKVIYTSGYSSEAVNGGREFEVGRNFLPKPYPLDELTTIVRQRLDER